MTGNKLLDYLLDVGDDNSSICELLELIKRDEDYVIDLCKDGGIPNLDELNENTTLLVAKLCAILDYKIGLKRLPSWVCDKRLYYDNPIYVGRMDDFTRAKVFIFAPQAFLSRNIYFNIDGLKRF